MFWSYTLSILLLGCGMLLMFVVLLQRGRGGGLAGAFGGAGGQSALGTKAGDVFTKITVILAAIWVILAGVTGLAMQKEQTGRFPGGSAAAPENPEMESTADDDATEGATDEGTDGEEAGGGPSFGTPAAPAEEGDGGAADSETGTDTEPGTNGEAGTDDDAAASTPADDQPATPPASE